MMTANDYGVLERDSEFRKCLGRIELRAGKNCGTMATETKKYGGRAGIQL
jgi:hypothetical protein